MTMVKNLFPVGMVGFVLAVLTAANFALTLGTLLSIGTGVMYLWA